MSLPVITVCETYGTGRCEVIVEDSRVKGVRGRGCTLGRSSRFVYFIINDEVLHVSQLPGSRVVKAHDNEVCWEVPANVIAGKIGFEVSFTRRHSEPIITLFKVREGITESNELNKVIEPVNINENDLVKYVWDGKLKFRYFGNEGAYDKLYLDMVLKLIDEFRNNLNQCGLKWSIKGDVAGSIVENPALEYLHAMIFPFENSRLNAFHQRITKSYELWVLSKVIRALCDAGGKPLNDKASIYERWLYLPVITFSFGNKCVHILYQADIVTHVAKIVDIEKNPCIPKWIPECLSKCGVSWSRVHTAPDIMLMMTNCGEKVELECYAPFRMPLTWQYFEKIPLIIETKLRISKTRGRGVLSEYETLSVAIKQVCMYKCLLRDRPRITVVTHDSVNDDVKDDLMKAGATVIDELMLGNEARINELLNIIRGSLGI
ncbi:hypothetical protein [Vulcanisaeta sp. JCM 14467]|uniref:hypothetical protein n=1 Tax=Vulcanisaeta sp. JCM 14467 TaxID=1295370 RepID=UPI0006D2BF30|nr:hypothetical protein [Vulcanisaeta sp. JCM 14467]